MFYKNVTGHTPQGTVYHFPCIHSDVLETLEGRKWVFFGHHHQMIKKLGLNGTRKYNRAKVVQS